MALEDRIAAAKEINELLSQIVRLGAFRLKYRIAVDPPPTPGAEWDNPSILVDFSGPDSELLVERGGELLHALEMITVESVGDLLDENERISFDALGFVAERTAELMNAARIAADKVRDSGEPFAFQPMNSRERRIVHLSLKESADLRTESEGEGASRRLVVYPRDYRGPAPAPLERERSSGGRGFGGRDRDRRGGGGGRGGDRGGRGGFRGRR